MNKSVEKENLGKCDLPKSKPLTITRDNIFKKQPHLIYFDKESPCLEYLKTQPNLHQFAEDLTCGMAKRFFAIDYDTIYSLSQLKKFHLYEYFDRDDKLKLFMDIDIKPHNIPEGVNREEYFDDIVNEGIELVVDQLKKYGINNPRTIILSSNRPDKLSAHVIFPDVVFENIGMIKFFMSQLRSYLIDKEIIDLNPYRKGGLRLLWNSKMGVYVNLEYNRGIDYEYEDDKQLFMDCLVKNISDGHQIVGIELPKNIKVIKKKKPINPKVELTEYSDVNYPLNQLAKYVNILDKKRADKYRLWLEIGMILHNCNPTKQSFNIWDKWSKDSGSYDSKEMNMYKWNGFKFGYFSIGTLKHYAKMDNPEGYETIEYSLEERIFKSLKFSANYLLNLETENIKDNASFISKFIIEWMEGNLKTLAIRSTYDTGKTRLINKIIKEFGLKRVLFISYRQTLTNDLHGSFIDLRVKSYLDGDYDADRIICQIESLGKLLPQMRFIGDKNYVPIYDLVVIDEIESVLNHFRSCTIPNKEYAFNLMRDFVFNANKVLALDGDLHNRSYTYLKHFGDSVIIENEIKKNKRHFIFSNNRNIFELNLANDLANGENIGLISMSSKLAMLYEKRFKDKYKTVLHCAKSDDKHKDKLKDVKTFWKQFQLVIYSPTIESGVNFDAEHFHKIYVILSPKSTSPRGLMQMMNRIRKLKNHNVMIYLNNMPFKEKASFYNYDEVREYVCEVFQTYLEPKTILDDQTNKMMVTYEFNLYSQILIYNETENANKCKNLFVPYLIKLFNEKGHTYEFKDTKVAKKGMKVDNVTKDDILKADDIDRDELNVLLNKQICNEATKEDKVKIERYMIKKDWKITEVSDEFLGKFYGKTEMLYNLRFLLDKTKIDPYMATENEGHVIDFDRATKLEQIEYIEEVIRDLGFDKVGGEKIDKETFTANIDKVIGGCKLFTNVNKSQPMFGYEKSKIRKVKTIKQFMGFMNSLLSEWGVVIEYVKSSKQIKTKNKWHSMSVSNYELNYLNDIDKYV